MTPEGAVEALRMVSIYAWAAVVAVNAWGGLRAFSRHPRSFDPFWAVFLGAGVNRLVFAAPRVLHHVETPVFAGWTALGQILSILLAAAMIAMPFWYSPKP